MKKENDRTNLKSELIHDDPHRKLNRVLENQEQLKRRLEEKQRVANAAAMCYNSPEGAPYWNKRASDRRSYMELNEMVSRLTALQKRIVAYHHAMGLISYDGQTTAPRGSGENRAETLGMLSEEIYKLTTGEETVALLDALAERAGELDETTNRIVEVMRRDILETRKIPAEEYIEFQKLYSISQDVWHEAKEKSDFSMFEPYLKRVVESMQKIARYVAPEKNAYDYWLDNFERGLTREKCDRFFGALKSGLVPLIEKVKNAPQPDDSFLHGDFPIEKQRILSDRLMEIMHIDRNHCGIGETEHPFTTNFTKYDVRITTNYDSHDFSSSMYSVIHEGGHALYELHIADRLAYTMIGSGVSMGIHESQSRFYENLLGRSFGFVKNVSPILRELFPHLESVTDEQLYRALNKSTPSLIRTLADELTYCLHVMVRYELEKRLFDGSLAVHDLPREWNRLYKETLGLDVPNDREGVLQDSHWSFGAIGYFPSYALGSAYGAQLLRKMRETVDVDACLDAGDLKPINAWLEEHIWQYGALYQPEALLQKALGEPFDPNCYVQYLTEKYSKLYNL
ncbi:MAG: carboxypeptidase M32 [Candidatus Faecivicinus sp.]|nr:carboxypeptidase M32 [Candidatus Faecivicinus sp.]